MKNYNNLSRLVKRRNGQRRLISEINVTPFVDVMLVMLIIFMITSQFAITSIDIDLPKTIAKPKQLQNNKLIEISIDHKNTIFLGKNKVSLPTLLKKLKFIAKQKRDLDIALRGDERLNYGFVISVMSALNRAGFNKISLITKVK